MHVYISHPHIYVLGLIKPPPFRGIIDMEYNDDSCIICHYLLDNPASTACGHTACLTCLLQWIAASMAEPQPLSTQYFRMPTDVQIDGLWFTCPLCRTETTAALNDKRRAQLQERSELEHSVNTDATDALQTVSSQTPWPFLG